MPTPLRRELLAPMMRHFNSGALFNGIASPVGVARSMVDHGAAQ